MWIFNLFDKLFGVLYFYLRKQDDDLVDASVTLNFNYQLSGAPDAIIVIVIPSSRMYLLSS